METQLGNYSASFGVSLPDQILECFDVVQNFLGHVQQSLMPRARVNHSRAIRGLHRPGNPIYIPVTFFHWDPQNGNLIF